MEQVWKSAELQVDEKSGKVRQTIGNCIKALRFDDRTKTMFRYNRMLGRIEVQQAWWNRHTVGLSGNDVNNIRLYLEQNYGLVHEKSIPRAIEIIANQNSYHPIVEYLNNLKWDGAERIENILPKYLGAEKNRYTTMAMLVFMLGAIERVHNPGTKFDTMLCLVDNNQGGGKSTLARLFAIKDEWFTDDIKRLDDENIYRKIQGHWIIEFSEMLAICNVKTVEELKNFLSKQKDTYKIPYELYPQDFPRQCIFLGTSNDVNFLPKDKTGNRRFIPVLTDKNKAEKHPLDNEQETREYINMAWAEAMEIYKSGKYSLIMPDDMSEQVEEVRKSFTPEDPKVGIIQEWLDTCEHDSVCSVMIYEQALKNEYKEPKAWELKEINEIMNNNIRGWEKHHTKDGVLRFKQYGRQRAWIRTKKMSTANVSTDGFMQVDNQMKLPFD